MRPPPNKALQLTWHSALWSRSGSLLAATLGGSASADGLCHAVERPTVRFALPDRRPPYLVEQQRLL